MNDFPNINDLSAEKTQVRSWVPPVVRKRLDKLAAESGVSMSKLTSNILTGAMYPELAGPILKYAKSPEPERDDAPQFDSVAEFKAYLLVEGLVDSAEDATMVAEMAMTFAANARSGGN